MNEQLTSDELSLDDMRSALAKWLAGLDGRQQNKRNIAGLLEAAFQRIDALKTRVDVLDVAFANSHQLNESLGDENRALRARVEAAEAEAARLAARVAELESQVAWRPGSENPPAPDWYQVGDIGVGVYDLWYSGEAWHRSSFQGATYRTPPMSTPDFWRFIPPLPPAPQERTP
jgi:hypothetical protein